MSIAEIFQAGDGLTLFILRSFHFAHEHTKSKIEKI